MKITSNVDPERQLVILSITSNLFSKYFYNFSGLIKNISGSFSGISVERESINEVNIVFPIPEGSETRRLDGNSRLMAISMDGEKMGKISEVIRKFMNTAMNKELKKVEFLPLSGYPLSDLKKDVEAAIKNKRNFCVIENYDDYLNMKEVDKREAASGESFRCYFNQIHFEYGTSEYSDIALDIISGKIKELREKLVPKMKKINWI